MPLQRSYLKGGRVPTGTFHKEGGDKKISLEPRDICANRSRIKHGKHLFESNPKEKPWFAEEEDGVEIPNWSVLLADELYKPKEEAKLMLQAKYATTSASGGGGGAAASSGNKTDPTSPAKLAGLSENERSQVLNRAMEVANASFATGTGSPDGAKPPAAALENALTSSTSQRTPRSPRGGPKTPQSLPRIESGNKQMKLQGVHGAGGSVSPRKSPRPGQGAVPTLPPAPSSGRGQGKKKEERVSRFAGGTKQPRSMER